MGIKDTDVRDIELSVRACNVLRRSGIETVGEMIQCSDAEIRSIRNCGAKTASEILAKIGYYKAAVRQEELTIERASADLSYREVLGNELFSPVSFENRAYKILSTSDYRDTVIRFAKENDVKLEGTDLSRRAKNALKRHGCLYIGDILYDSEDEYRAIPSVGDLALNEILDLVHWYLDENSSRIMAVICGDKDAFWTDDAIKIKVLAVFTGNEFGSVLFADLCDQLDTSFGISKARLQKATDSLVTDGILGKNEDGSLYRIYPGFEEYISACPILDERTRSVLLMRLHGDTLEMAGDKIGVTRERIRQIQGKGVKKVVSWHEAEDHTPLFAEDRYRYLYSTYNLSSARDYIQIDLAAIKYFELVGVDHGTVPVKDALSDPGVDDMVKENIRSYLSAGFADVDGEQVRIKHKDLEKVFLKKYGRDEMTFDEFMVRFNRFLESIGVPYNKKIYCSDDTARYRFSRLAEKRFVLWKDGMRLRYYDIDVTDFTGLLDTLNLGQYENIGFSTEILMHDHPAIMKKYDIRDKYELHNLLRKIVPEGSYHGFHCGRMPSISFGAFDMNDAMMDLLKELAPIRETELLEIASRRYGYSTRVIAANWTDIFIPYRHRGMLCIDFADIGEERKPALRKALTEDVYKIAEIRKIYTNLFPDADEAEINPYSLKGIGFSVASTIAYKNYTSLYQCFKDIASKSSDEEIEALKARFKGNQTLWCVLRDAKKAA